MQPNTPAASDGPCPHGDACPDARRWGAVHPHPDAPSSLGHAPDGAWRFDGDVTRVFDDMLERSVPDHAGMRAAVDEVSLHVLRAASARAVGMAVVDLGSSRGAAVARLVAETAGGVGAPSFYLVERSAPMRAVLERRFAEQIAEGRVTVSDLDLRTAYPPPRRVALTLAVLTLQFTPIELRQRIVRRAWESTVPGGAMIVVEKVLGSNGALDELLVELHHARKRAAGYSQEEIDRKRLSLEGVLVPVTARWNEDLLRGAGFADVEPVWRSLNFCAWVAVRE